MKQLLLACALIFALCNLGGCSKDNEPGNGNAKASGNFKIDGKNVNLKYAFLIEDGDFEYYFFDIDVRKYLDQDLYEIDKELSCLNFDIDDTFSEVTYLGFDYKVNYYRNSGIVYLFPDFPEMFSTISDYVDFQINKNKIKAYASEVPMLKVDYKNYELLEEGVSIGSFSVEGTPSNLSFIDEDNATRASSITEVTDPKLMKLLRSFRH